jgi:hypothetical protein
MYMGKNVVNGANAKIIVISEIHEVSAKVTEPSNVIVCQVVTAG